MPEGSVVGPILFVVCSNDLPLLLRSPIFLLSDDLKVVNSSSEAEDLAPNVHAAALYATQWVMKFNSANLKEINFGCRQVPILAVNDKHGRHNKELVNSFRS